MKKHEMYECEKCGKLFSVVKDAEKCEARHIKPEIITDYEYKELCEYPERITVRMGNGYLKEYYK